MVDRNVKLTKETVIATNTAGSSITTVNTYTYDSRNRLTEIAAKVNNVLTKVTGYTYDNNGNQLTTVVRSYANGTTITSTIATLTNAYDLHNQLIRSVTDNGTTINNSYNAEGYRVGKEVITGEGVREYTRFLYESDKVILETTETGSQKARNIYGTNLLMRITGSTVHQYLYNGHADVTALLTREGDIAATYYYDAFGNILESTGNVDNSILYAGYQYDIETGLYYLNARMYDPVTARFLQEDSYKGDPKDPLSLNLYTYCHNNPITYVDPTGHWLHIIAGTLIGGLLGGVIDAGSQMLLEKKSFREINWKSVGVSAVEGAITGAIGAATGGASLAASAGKEAVKQTGKQIVKKIAATAITEGIVGAGANAAAQYAVAGKVDTGQVLLTGVMDTITAGAGSAVPYTKLGKKLNMVGQYISSKTDTMVKNIQSTFSPQLSPKAALAGGVEIDPNTLFSSTDISSPAVMKNTTQTNFNEVYHSRNSSIVDATDSINMGSSQARLIPGDEGIVTGGDSTKMGKNMMESMGLTRNTKWSGYQAQHIIPAEMADNPVLQKIGMNLDDASNGLFLRTPADDISTMSRHRGYHSTYNEFVKSQLDSMDITQSTNVLQQQVLDLQINLKNLQQSGLPLYPSQGSTVDLWQRSLDRIK